MSGQVGCFFPRPPSLPRQVVALAHWQWSSRLSALRQEKKKKSNPPWELSAPIPRPSPHVPYPPRTLTGRPQPDSQRQPMVAIMPNGCGGKGGSDMRRRGQSVAGSRHMQVPSSPSPPLAAFRGMFLAWRPTGVSIRADLGARGGCVDGTFPLASATLIRLVLAPLPLPSWACC